MNPQIIPNVKHDGIINEGDKNCHLVESVPAPLTALQWFERARDTLRQRLNEEEDTELLDIFDDICNGLDVMSGRTL